MESNILEIIENALARAGYKILDGERESIVIRDAAGDCDYRIRVTEVAV